MTQGETYPTIGCIVPSVVSLDNSLVEMTSTVVHHPTVVRALQESLRRRFLGLFQRLQIVTRATDSQIMPDESETFGSMIYPMATLLDARWGLPVSYTHLTLPTKRIV